MWGGEGRPPGPPSPDRIDPPRGGCRSIRPRRRSTVSRAVATIRQCARRAARRAAFPPPPRAPPADASRRATLSFLHPCETIARIVMPEGRFTVAAAQVSPRLGDVEANVALYEKTIAEARGRGADL